MEKKPRKLSLVSRLTFVFCEYKTIYQMDYLNQRNQIHSEMPHRFLTLSSWELPQNKEIQMKLIRVEWGIVHELWHLGPFLPSFLYLLDRRVFKANL